MESAHLLVVDRSPERAEHVNSALRNSGINIHITHASKALDVKRALEQTRPVLVLFCEPDDTAAALEEVHSIASEHMTPLALFCDVDDPVRLTNQLKSTACLVIDSGNAALLTDTVRRLLAGSRQSNRFLEQKSRLEELEHRYELLLDSARDAIAYVHEGLHVYANRAYLEALHVESADAIAGLSLLEMMDARDGNLKKLLQGLSKGDLPSAPVKVSVKRPDGMSFDAELTFSPARFNGEDCIQMLMQESNAEAELAAQLERLRVTDPITRLGNKRALVDRVEALLSEPHSSDHVSAVLYLEPDGIAHLHDELDVRSMDALVIGLAKVLQSSVADSDYVARISDQGFAVLASRRNMEQMEEAATAIRNAFAGHLAELEDRSFSVTCSIGIATLGRLAKDATAVIAGARKAQAEAAAQGNRTLVFRPQLTAVSTFEDDRQWLDRIRLALRNRDFYSVQQPIVDLDGEGEHLVENLLYLRNEGGDLEASRFMPIAERNDLGGQIDRQVIPGLFKGFAEGGDCQIVNLSTNSMLDFAFPAWLSGQMSELCIEGRRLILQIGATAAQGNLKPVQRLMQELKPTGCLLSISGFGADRRQLQILEHLQPNYVKIHPSLTTSLTGNAAHQEVIRGIVDAADRCKAAVIADEVADTPSLATLWQCGVKLIAGAFLRESSQVVAQ